MSAVLSPPANWDSLSEMLFESLGEVYEIIGKAPEALVLSQADYELLMAESEELGYLPVSCEPDGPGMWCGVALIVSEGAEEPYFTGQMPGLN